MLVGLLFHNALENFYKTGEPTIDNKLIEEFAATQETTLLVQSLVLQYQRTYPLHEFPVRSIEKGLEFPLRFLTPGREHPWKGVSKVDMVFELANPQRVQLNESDSTELPAGIYGLEHKTRSRASSTWQESWETSIQAAFEMLAIQHNFGRCDGILVNTIEYKLPYQPVRTCKLCGEKSELRYWHAVQTGAYKCPLCQKVSEFTPRKREPDPPPNIYRFLVTRQPGDLTLSEMCIAEIASEMAKSVKQSETWMRFPSCVDARTGSVCAYKQWHINDNDTGLVQLENPYEYIYR